MVPFIGEIKLLAYNHAIINWLLCDGSIQQIRNYQELFALLGNHYGGDGKTTFALPDLRGRVPMCPLPTSQTYNVPGKQGGVESVTLTPDNLPQHIHAMNVSSATATLTNSANNYYASTGVDALIYAPAPVNLAIDPDSVESFGGDGAHENMQPSIALAYYISTAGNWPSPGGPENSSSPDSQGRG